MKTTFEKVRLWLYLPLTGLAVLLALYYSLTSAAGVGFDRFLASQAALAPFGVFALGYLPSAERFRHRLPLISASVHLAGDLLFAFCHRIERPYGISAWNYFRSVEFLSAVAVVIAALLLCSRKSFAVLSGTISFGMLMSFNEVTAFRTVTFGVQVAYFGLLALFAWDALPDTDGLVRFFRWLFEKDAEIEDETPVTERHTFCDRPAWKYGFEYEEFDEELDGEDEENWL